MSRLKHESSALAWEEANGTVTEVFPKLCRVRLDQDGRILLCSYRRAQVYNRSTLNPSEDEKPPEKKTEKPKKFDKRSDRKVVPAVISEPPERAPVAVGDRVKVQALGSQDGVIEGVAQRRNQLMRLSPGREGQQVHVLASNVDLLVAVASARDPEFSPGLVDRFLVASRLSGIPALLCVNKMDLHDGLPGVWEMYRELHVDVLKISAHTGRGMLELEERIRSGLSVFCGHSGVGKTSLLRKLLGADVGRVGEVSDSGKGKHTTTGAVLLEGRGLRVIDTPGVKEFGLPGVSPEDLKDYFPEFDGLKCEAISCLHDRNEGCAAKDFPRHESYLRILETLREETERKAAHRPKPGRKSPSR